MNFCGRIYLTIIGTMDYIKEKICGWKTKRGSRSQGHCIPGRNRKEIVLGIAAWIKIVLKTTE